MAGAIVQTAKQSSALGTVTATFPSATTAGNVIVIGFASDDYNASPGAGWFQQTGCEQQTFHGGYLWYRISAGETSFQYVIGSATNSAFVVAEISGLDTSDLYDVSNGQFTQVGGQTTYTTSAITPSTGDRFLVAFMGASEPANLSAASWGTWINSFTAIDSGGSGGSGTNDLAGLAYRRVTGNGSTSFSTGATASTVTASRSGIIIAFKEAAALGPLVDLTASSVTTSSPTIGAPALAPLLNISILTGGTQANSAINGGNVTLTFPTLQQGDVVIVFGGHFIRAGGDVFPTGYTPIYDSGTSAGTDPRLGICYKVMGATPDTTVSCPGSGNAADGTAYGCYCLRNVDTSVIVDATTTAVGPTTSNNPDCPSITTVTNRALVLAIALDHIAGTGDTSITNPTNYIEQRTARGADNNDATVCAGALVKTVAGAEDPPSFTAWTAGTWRAATVAIRVATSATAVTASNLTTTAPSLPAATIAQIHALSASSLTTSTKTLGAPAAVGNVSLSASTLTTSVPTIGAPSLVHIIPFTASSLTTSVVSLGAPALIRLSNAIASTLTTTAPTIGAPSLAPVYNLVGSNKETTAPTIGAPALVGNISLSASSLTTSAAIVNQATFTPFHGLLPSGLSLQSPLIGNTSLIGNVALTASVLSTSAPSFSATSLVVVYNFIASDLSISSPSFTQPTFQPSAIFIAAGVTTSSPAVNSTALGVVVNLVAASVQTSSPTIGAPATVGNIEFEISSLEIAPPEFEDLVFNQRQALGASSLSTGPPQIFNVQLFLVGETAAADLQTSSPTLGEPALVERVDHLDSISFETSPPTLAHAVFKQIHALTASSLESGVPVVGSTALKQAHALVAVFDPISIEIGAPDYNKIANFVASPIVRSAIDVGAPTSNLIRNLTAASKTIGAVTFSSPTIRSDIVFIAPNVTSDAPTIGAPDIVVYSTLNAASLQTSAITFDPVFFDNGFRDLVATYLHPSPLLGSPPLGQQHVLSSVIWAPPYAALPSPIVTHRSTQEPLHSTKLVGVRSGVRATVNGTRQTRRVTVSGSRRITSVNGVTQT